MARQTLFAFGCVLLLAFASSVRADDDNVHDPDTIVLTNDNFNSYVDNEDLILVEFYAPWCGHCKRLAPEYAKAATTLKSNDPPVKLAKLDATAHSEAAGKFGISGYPTLKVFRNGQPSDYKGPRDADGIVAYMKKQVGPAAKLVETEKDLERYLSTPDVNFWVLGLFGQGTTKSALHSAFLLTANKLREDHVFLKTTNPDILKKYDVSTEAVLALKLFDDRQTKFTKTGTKALEEFIAQNSIPLVGEFNATTAELYQRQDKPILKLFVKVDWASNFRHTQYYINRLKDVATTHRADLLVALADIDKQSQEMESLNLKDKVAPLVIDDRGVKYVSTEKFSAENVKKFVESFQSGDAEKYVKSEDVPKDNKGPVKTVVGKTFEDIVLDDEKDVMIEFYAPWCGHCKSLEPKYKELGQKFKKDKNVVIAKIDATANDFPRDTFEVSGYPTIFFKPAGQSPKKYEGDREVSAMSAFIKKHAKAGKKSKKKN